jgi:hypothetical protein
MYPVARREPFWTVQRAMSKRRSMTLLARGLHVARFRPTLFRLTADGTEGWYGVLRALLFAVLVLTLTLVLTRFKFRLQL